MTKSLFTFLLANLILAVANQAVAANNEPLRIAFIDPLSGPAANMGEPALAQVKFDVKRINKEGGINGHPIKIIAMDDQMTSKKALVKVHEAIDQGIRYIVQGMSSAVASAIENAVDKHNRRNSDKPVIYFNYSGTDPALTNERCSFWNFRFIANTTMTMKILTDWIATQKDIHKVFLINPDYSFGHVVSNSARKMLKKKRPDIEIVGNAFQPTLKVKDFSPYITKIKASGADAVITGNFGSDMILLIKAAASYGLDIPFVTYFGNTPGAVSALGNSGVGRLYVVTGTNGDFKDPQMAQLEEKMYKETNWDFSMPRITYMFGMLKKAAAKAGSTDPTKVAFALEGLHYDSYFGPVVMRAKDHQIMPPYFVSVLKDDMKYGAEGTDLNFHALASYPAKATAMPTTCRMRRPGR
jgi:branched-chain amino acid transport system substrate-binding protein